MDVRTTGSLHIVRNVNLRSTAQTVPWTVVTVNMANRVQRIQGIALVDAKKGGQEEDAIYNVSMGRMFHTENVSNVKVCVRTKHLVIYLQVDVMTVAVITGLESFVKSVLMGFTTKTAAVYVDFV